jgi:response regulator RpfG family c-di-GMP phosphodiesterase
MDKSECGKLSFYQLIQMEWPSREEHPIVQCIQKEGHLAIRELTGKWRNGEAFSLQMGFVPIFSEDEREIEGVMVNIQDKSLEENLHIKYRKTIAQIKAEFDQSVRIFSNITDRLESGRDGVSARVAMLAKDLALELGLEDKDVAHVEVAGRLHLIGTMGMSQELLNKKYRDMVDWEREEYEKHTVLGALIFDGIGSFKGVCDVIRQYRERYDGSGYPLGLAREGIQMGAYVVGLAVDVAEWMEENPHWSITDYIRQVEKGSAQTYPSSLVEAFKVVMGSQKHFLKNREKHLISLDDLRPGMTLSKNIRSGKGVLLAEEGEKIAPASLARMRRFHESDPMHQDIEVYSTGEEHFHHNDNHVEELGASETKFRNVLVVDDTEELNLLLCRMINKADYLRAEGVYSGSEALEYLRLKNCDVILLDVMMPVMTGLQTLEEIRKISPQLPVVMCTAKSGQEDILEAFRLGADDYLVKPVKKNVLKQTLDRIFLDYGRVEGDISHLRKKQLSEALRRISPDLSRQEQDDEDILSIRYRVVGDQDSKNFNTEGNAEVNTEVNTEAKAKSLGMTQDVLALPVVHEAIIQQLEVDSLLMLSDVEFDEGCELHFAVENVSQQKLLLVGEGKLSWLGNESSKDAHQSHDREGFRIYRVNFSKLQKVR